MSEGAVERISGSIDRINESLGNVKVQMDAALRMNQIGIDALVELGCAEGGHGSCGGSCIRCRALRDIQVIAEEHST